MSGRARGVEVQVEVGRGDVDGDVFCHCSGWVGLLGCKKKPRCTCTSTYPSLRTAAKITIGGGGGSGGGYDTNLFILPLLT